MCFRPSSASKPIECPGCGKKLAVVAGIKQKKCPICKADLENLPAEKPAQDETKE